MSRYAECNNVNVMMTVGDGGDDGVAFVCTSAGAAEGVHSQWQEEG